MQYRSMSHMPAHGNARQASAGNARESFSHTGHHHTGHHGKYGSMKGDYAPGMAGGHYMEQECPFPQPPPKRCYCTPAGYTSLDGRKYHRILDAYGHSRPCRCCY